MRMNKKELEALIKRADEAAKQERIEKLKRGQAGAFYRGSPWNWIGGDPARRAGAAGPAAIEVSK